MIRTNFQRQPAHERVLGFAYHSLNQKDKVDKDRTVAAFKEVLIDLYKWQITVRWDYTTHETVRNWVRNTVKAAAARLFMRLKA